MGTSDNSRKSSQGLGNKDNIKTVVEAPLPASFTSWCQHDACPQSDKTCFDNNLPNYVGVRSYIFEKWLSLKWVNQYFIHIWTPLESGRKGHLLFQEWSLQVMSQVGSELTGHHKNAGSITSPVHTFLWSLEASNESPCCLSRIGKSDKAAAVCLLVISQPFNSSLLTV